MRASHGAEGGKIRSSRPYIVREQRSSCLVLILQGEFQHVLLPAGGMVFTLLFRVKVIHGVPHPVWPSSQGRSVFPERNRQPEELNDKGPKAT